MAITPPDSPSSPENFAQVATSQMNIQAPMSDGEVTAAFDASLAVGGSGVLYPQGPRQAQTQQLLESPQGFASGGYDIDAGSAFGWPNDVEPDVAGP